MKTFAVTIKTDTKITIITQAQKYVELKPAIFSKSQTVVQISQKLLEYPEQRNNTPQALKGLTIEFIDFDGPDYGQPVGTLLAAVSNDISLFMIKARDGGQVLVEKVDDKFYPRAGVFTNA